jgi:hypothetical protein
MVYGFVDPEFRTRASVGDAMSRLIDLLKQDFMRFNQPLPRVRLSYWT